MRYVSLLLATALLPCVSARGFAQTFQYGLELTSPTCGSVIEAVPGSVVTIEGFATLTTSDPIKGLGQSLLVDNPDGVDFCFDVAPIESCTPDPCKRDIYGIDLFDFLSAPSVIQNAGAAGCAEGSGDQDSPYRLRARLRRNLILAACLVLPDTTVRGSKSSFTVSRLDGPTPSPAITT